MQNMKTSAHVVRCGCVHVNVKIDIHYIRFYFIFRMTCELYAILCSQVPNRNVDYHFNSITVDVTNIATLPMSCRVNPITCRSCDKLHVVQHHSTKLNIEFPLKFQLHRHSHPIDWNDVSFTLAQIRIFQIFERFTKSMTDNNTLQKNNLSCHELAILLDLLKQHLTIRRVVYCVLLLLQQKSFASIQLF